MSFLTDGAAADNYLDGHLVSGVDIENVNFAQFSVDGDHVGI